MSVRPAELRFHRQKFELAMDWPGNIDEESQLAAMPSSPRIRGAMVGSPVRRSGGNRGDAGDRHGRTVRFGSTCGR
jgi:hypothetical protein